MDPIFIGFGDLGLLAWSRFVGFGCVSSPLFMGVSVSLGVHRWRLTSGAQFLRFQAAPNTSRRIPPSDIRSVPTLRGRMLWPPGRYRATRAVAQYPVKSTVTLIFDSHTNAQGPTARHSQRPQNFSRPHRRASFLRIGHDANNPRKVKRSSPRQLPTFPNSCAEPILEDLPAAVSLANKSAATVCFAPIGSRYVEALPAGSSLAPDTSVIVKLAFSDPSGAAISYTPLVAGSLGGAP